MIRFPNPGSDIPTFIHIFQTLYSYLREQGLFSLDNISKTLTEMNLAASSGYVGEQALKLSTRADRSRDPLYNQSKMYAELYRSLGWITSSEEKALLYTFTLLGDHVAAAKVDPKSIFEESVLGINYPNQIIDNKSQDASRTFAAILLSALEMDGLTCRDEIIVGAMNVNDMDMVAFGAMIAKLKSFRGNIKNLQAAIQELSEKNKIQINTLQNYTRFPMSVLMYCGWFDKTRQNTIYPNGRNMVVLKMTPYGRERAEWIKRVLDIRIDNYEQMDVSVKPSLIRLGFYSMLQRSNFDVSPVSDMLSQDESATQSVKGDRELLFSPFQTIKLPEVNAALGIEDSGYKINANRSVEIGHGVEDAANHKCEKSRIHLLQRTINSTTLVHQDSEIARIILKFQKEGKSEYNIVDKLFAHFRKANQSVFYPLIADLFTILGFQCTASRAGINYERWDAIIIDENYTMPIEIKSPGEEEFISIKAVRQALENKVILLSRKPYKTDWNTVTLAVGYNMPNDRAEVARLIEDIKLAFGISIGIIDFKTLLLMAVKTLAGTASISLDDIRGMEGLINVKNT